MLAMQILRQGCEYDKQGCYFSNKSDRLFKIVHNKTFRKHELIK